MVPPARWHVHRGAGKFCNHMLWQALTHQRMAARAPLPLPQVLSVDRAVQPPSYAVQVGGSVRETEAERLRLRCAGQPPPSSEPPACASAGAATWRAAGTLPNGAPADAWEEVALPAAPQQLWSFSRLGALPLAANGCAAAPSSPGSDGFGDFADSPPAIEAGSNFGSFCAAGSVAGSAAGASPRAHEPPLGGAERSPFEEALAFAHAAPVHEPPAAWPDAPPADWGAAAAERTALAAEPQHAAPALASDAAQPPDEPEEWTWAGEAEAPPAASSQALPACLDRSALCLQSHTTDACSPSWWYYADMPACEEAARAHAVLCRTR